MLPALDFLSDYNSLGNNVLGFFSTLVPLKDLNLVSPVVIQFSKIACFHVLLLITCFVAGRWSYFPFYKTTILAIGSKLIKSSSLFEELLFLVILSFEVLSLFSTESSLSTIILISWFSPSIFLVRLVGNGLIERRMAWIFIF